LKGGIVVDTGVLSLFFAGDARVKPYFDNIMRGGAIGYMTSINLAEFYYRTCRRLGSETAFIRYRQSREILEAVETDDDLALTAGREMGRRSGLCFADCFALALSRKENAVLLTTDSELAKVDDVRVKLFKVDG
jgi:predicted nucleic acid-binding protein